MESFIIAVTPAATHVGKEGYAVVANGSGAAAVSNSGTDLPIGPVVSGSDTTGRSTVALPGAIAPVKLGGTVKALDLLKLHTDGTYIKDAAGARTVCARALQDGISGDLCPAHIMAPIPYAS